MKLLYQTHLENDTAIAEDGDVLLHHLICVVHHESLTTPL